MALRVTKIECVVTVLQIDFVISLYLHFNILKFHQKITGVINTVGSTHQTHSGLKGGLTTKTAVITAMVPPIMLVKCLEILSLPVADSFF